MHRRATRTWRWRRPDLCLSRFVCALAWPPHHCVKLVAPWHSSRVGSSEARVACSACSLSTKSSSPVPLSLPPTAITTPTTSGHARVHCACHAWYWHMRLRARRADSHFMCWLLFLMSVQHFSKLLLFPRLVFFLRPCKQSWNPPPTHTRAYFPPSSLEESVLNHTMTMGRACARLLTTRALLL